MSRELARRGNNVTHVFFSDFQTPRGSVALKDYDPATLDIVSLTLGVPFAKSAFLKRRRQEIEYGRKLAELILKLRPDTVISSNAPLDSQWEIMKACRQIKGCRFIFWLQDFYGEAIYRILGAKLGILGRLVGSYYIDRERRMLLESDHVISICEDFVPLLLGKGLQKDSITVAENWAPLDEIAPRPKENEWSIANGFAATRNIVYSGTLGYKHNPNLLMRLAAETDANVLVFSEGKVADELARDARRRGISSLSVRPWVDYRDLPNVLGSADILVALIEPDAGIFSVPSKVLTYSCIGRPILASIPESNLAARIILREQSGLIAAPTDGDIFIANARQLLANDRMRYDMGRNGRAYAEREFGIAALGNDFEDIILKSRLTRSPPRFAN